MHQVLGDIARIPGHSVCEYRRQGVGATPCVCSCATPGSVFRSDGIGTWKAMWNARD